MINLCSVTSTWNA